MDRKHWSIKHHNISKTPKSTIILFKKFRKKRKSYNQGIFGEIKKIFVNEDNEG